MDVCDLGLQSMIKAPSLPLLLSLKSCNFSKEPGAKFWHEENTKGLQVRKCNSGVIWCKEKLWGYLRATHTDVLYLQKQKVGAGFICLKIASGRMGTMEANRDLSKPSTESSVEKRGDASAGLSCVGGWKSDVAVLAEACGSVILAELYFAAIVCSSCRKLFYCHRGRTQESPWPFHAVSFAGILHKHFHLVTVFHCHGLVKNVTI